MNILFLLKSFEIGGLEVVTSVLANKFVSEGHNVVIWAFYKGKTSIADRFDNHIALVYGHGFNSCKENVASLRKVLIDNDINVVINQWGLPFVPARTLKRATVGLKVKVIAVYHNDPMSNGRTKEVEIALERCDSPFKRSLLRLKLYFFKGITAASMRYIYRNSDMFMVLSRSFIKHFEDYTGIDNAAKIVVQTNPVTIDSVGFVYNFDNKRKEVLFVGRLDYNQKRVHRVIETWAFTENKYSDWHLTIVGDGTERINLEKFVRELNLKNVSFEGFQSPRPYYERASLLILTSEFEGFPLVLAECMCFGVVPIVYGSYSAVYDIIEDGKNGLVVKPENGEFHAEVLTKTLQRAMADNDLCRRMSVAAVETSKEYSIDVIYRQWNKLMESLVAK